MSARRQELLQLQGRRRHGALRAVGAACCELFFLFQLCFLSSVERCAAPRRWLWHIATHNKLLSILSHSMPEFFQSQLHSLAFFSRFAANPCIAQPFAAMVDRRTLSPEPWVSALQRLAEDVLESHATLHERIDKLSFRVQALWAYICSIERRTSPWRARLKAQTHESLFCTSWTSCTAQQPNPLLPGPAFSSAKPCRYALATAKSAALTLRHSTI